MNRLVAAAMALSVVACDVAPGQNDGGGAGGGAAGGAGGSAGGGTGGAGGGTTGGGSGGSGGGASGGGAGGAGGGSFGGGAGGAGGGQAGGSGGGSGGAGGAGGGSGGSGGGAAGAQLFAFVGGSGPGIGVYKANATTGALTLQSVADAGAGANPSFLAIHPSKKYLYAVLEGSSQVMAFAINATTGALSPLNRVGSGGNGPAHVSVDTTGGWVLNANYSGGQVAVHGVKNDGSLVTNTSANPSAGMNAHLIVTDPANRFAFVPCLGSDYIAQYVFNQDAGTLTANATATVASVNGAGPRHLAFHPTLPYAYAMNELNSTVTAYSYDANTGRLTSIQSLSSLPAGFSGSNSGAEIAVHPNGKWVFSSNRGDNSIAVFAVNSGTGQLAFRGTVKTGGATPRHFSLNADGTRLWAANQGSNNVTALTVNPEDGGLSGATAVASFGTAQFVQTVLLP